MQSIIEKFTIVNFLWLGLLSAAPIAPQYACDFLFIEFTRDPN